jgi:hypothetical protein
MRSRGMLAGDVEATLALYLQQCSVQVTCRDLAVMAATLANGAVNPLTGQSVMPRSRVRDVLSVMHTRGMYDFAGQWAYEVGVPAKSGVSGGLLTVIPGKMGIGVKPASRKAIIAVAIGWFGDTCRPPATTRQIVRPPRAMDRPSCRDDQGDLKSAVDALPTIFTTRELARPTSSGDRFACDRTSTG